MGEDEFGFGNIPVITFVNVKGMKDGAVCLDYTFAEGAVSKVQSP